MKFAYILGGLACKDTDLCVNGKETSQLHPGLGPVYVDLGLDFDSRILIYKAPAICIHHLH